MLSNAVIGAGESGTDRRLSCFGVVTLPIRSIARRTVSCVVVVGYRIGLHIGVTSQTIAAIEAGKYSPSREAAFRIAGVFNVPLGEVFSWQNKSAE